MEKIILKRTKIVATLGPASSDPAVIEKMINAGANVFRLNFSHGNHETHLKNIKQIREISEKTGIYVGILGDLCGPKIRVGKFESGFAVLEMGDHFFLSEDPLCVGTKAGIGTSYPYLTKDIKPGNIVLLDDGNIMLEALYPEDNRFYFRVLAGGVLKDKKGLNMPGINLSVETITQKDKEDLRFIIENELDFVALSFVRRAQDVIELKQLLNGADLRIIAKIEKPEAISELDKILDNCEGVMIARGDLGVELPVQTVPAIQKQILKRCSDRGKTVITATQMLESMMENQIPTRAETTDVYNAIVDGSDAVMLSGETAAGKHPVKAVKMMADIALEAEKAVGAVNFHYILPGVERKLEEVMAQCACEASYNACSKAIVTFTHSGNTALNISKYHPPTLIFALTPFQKTCRRLSLSWGVVPVIVKDMKSTDEMLAEAEQVMKRLEVVKSGEIITMVAGLPIGFVGNTNFMKLHKVS
ncbi:MAG: Pyruvate kinase [bacterium ADurb.Bin157]|nr:MAG: Pyruvate kinase [bacterium ADurb.Bin157]